LRPSFDSNVLPFATARSSQPSESKSANVAPHPIDCIDGCPMPRTSATSVKCSPVSTLATFEARFWSLNKD
jgi:hypothetical protein